MLLFALLPMLAAAPVTLPEKLEPGMPFPELKGEFLTGRKAVLPAAARGKVALLAMGFTYDSRFSVEAYVNRFKADFGTDTRSTFFEVPMIGGMARMGKWFIDSGMRRGTPKNLHENVITVYGGIDPWKKMFGYKEGNDAYIILLDADGKVQWMYHGGFKEDRYLQVKELTLKLVGGQSGTTGPSAH